MQKKLVDVLKIQEKSDVKGYKKCNVAENNSSAGRRSSLSVQNMDP
jgi:hypothetical protein